MHSILTDSVAVNFLVHFRRSGDPRKAPIKSSGSPKAKAERQREDSVAPAAVRLLRRSAACGENLSLLGSGGRALGPAIKARDEG